MTKTLFRIDTEQLTMPTPNHETCSIPADDAVFERYHDEEWGVPTSCEHALFEKICLEGFQSGLSWRTILHKRDDFRQAFDHFEPLRVQCYTDADINRLMDDKRIIRNRRKILSTINNARRLVELQADGQSLAAFIWSFEPPDESRPSRVSTQWLRDNTKTAESSALSIALKKRGWTFVGPTNMYALMQAMGIVNDHAHDCPQRKTIEGLRQQFTRPTSSATKAS